MFTFGFTQDTNSGLLCESAVFVMHLEQISCLFYTITLLVIARNF